ncbi:uncharacterized protein LOC124133768 [Haliotis rufescens]|uniref:uncharacterized protein LOC124133768 n=1 Tax=Haliotis rufescens TaxID=6454 RepID=UPI00201EE7DA|nr:uncharacterized protein LOC124133768 [Haliotis rufescens]
MSLVLIDLEMESDHPDIGRTSKKTQESPKGFKAMSDDLEIVSLDLDTAKAENKDQTGDQVYGADDTKLTEHTRKEKAKSKKTKDVKEARDAKKNGTSQKRLKPKQKNVDTRKKQTNERDTEDTVEITKWDTLRRLVHALRLRRSGTSSSQLNRDDFGYDDIRFNGHLFEYAPHPPIVPQVDVPRLRLGPTLKERLYNIADRLLRCGSVRHHNQYTL